MSEETRRTLSEALEELEAAESQEEWEETFHKYFSEDYIQLNTTKDMKSKCIKFSVLDAYDHEVEVNTQEPLMMQLRTLGCKFRLTANDPYPTFLVEYDQGDYWLFNQNGEKVDTMMGTFGAYSFDEVTDFRELFSKGKLEVMKCRELS